MPAAMLALREGGGESAPWRPGTVSGSLRVGPGGYPMVRGLPTTHTRDMEYVFTKILDLSPIVLVSVPIIVATVFIALLVGTGIVGRVALLLEDLRAGERTEPSC